MATRPHVTIIGIGDDGLDAVSEYVKKLIHEAALLAANERILDMVDDEATSAERLIVGADLEAAVDRIASVAQTEPVAVLVSGDPLFYGLARFLCDRIGREGCEIIPHVSSMQLAFARVKESWDEAYLTDLANHPLESVIERIRVAPKVGLFTSDTSSPSEVAAALLKRRIDYFVAYVCENLGSRNERVTFGSLSEIAEQSFDSLNVMILVRDVDAPDRPRDAIRRSLFGNPDESFVQSKPKQGLLTTSEVRAIALAQLELEATSVVWDVGAGSGSVSVEAARLSPAGHIYAIEQDPDDADLIEQNKQRFGVDNVSTIIGRAPEVWADLPDPDAVFLEGSGREISRLAELALDRLRPGGRLVASVVSIEGLHELRNTLAVRTSQLEVTMVHISRGMDQLDRLRFDSRNPVFLVSAGR